MSLSRLRERALSHLLERRVSYPVCLDANIAAKMKLTRDALDKAVMAAAFPNPDGPPQRRTIGDRIGAGEAAVAELNEQINVLIREAVEADALVILTFGIPEAAGGNPGAYFETIAAPYDAAGGRSVNDRAIRRELVGLSYLGATSAADEDLDLPWDDVASKVLSHTDLENLDDAVLRLYREDSLIPFDPASYGVPTPS